VAADRSDAAGSVKRTVDGFERTVGVNHLGHFALVNALMPALVASAAASRQDGRGWWLVLATSSSAF
jgi:NAD(P)-dependent dehydrogenase (short-subunit alcohol dehydrogenase family)